MYVNRVLLLVLVLIFVLYPLAQDWIGGGGTQWYRPHLLWLGVIVAVSLSMRLDRRDEP